MLEQYLFSRFRVMALRAPVPENEGQFLQDIYKPAYHYGGPGKFAFSKEMQEDLVDLNDFASYAPRMLKSWSEYAVGDGSYLLEKSPPNITKIWWLRRVFPDAVFIVWTRDPRAVSGATLKWSNTSLEELMQHWSVAYSFAKQDMDANTITMCYEDFCASPELTLERSGLPEILTRRSNALEIPQRFQSISNTNYRYLKGFNGKPSAGEVWEEFGYHFNKT